MKEQNGGALTFFIWLPNFVIHPNITYFYRSKLSENWQRFHEMHSATKNSNKTYHDRWINPGDILPIF